MDGDFQRLVDGTEVRIHRKNSCIEITKHEVVENDDQKYNIKQIVFVSKQDDESRKTDSKDHNNDVSIEKTLEETTHCDDQAVADDSYSRDFDQLDERSDNVDNETNRTITPSLDYQLNATKEHQTSIPANTNEEIKVDLTPRGRPVKLAPLDLKTMSNSNESKSKITPRSKKSSKTKSKDSVRRNLNLEDGMSTSSSVSGESSLSSARSSNTSTPRKEMAQKKLRKELKARTPRKYENKVYYVVGTNETGGKWAKKSDIKQEGKADPNEDKKISLDDVKHEDENEGNSDSMNYSVNIPKLQLNEITKSEVGAQTKKLHNDEIIVDKNSSYEGVSQDSDIVDALAKMERVSNPISCQRQPILSDHDGNDNKVADENDYDDDFEEDDTDIDQSGVQKQTEKDNQTSDKKHDHSLEANTKLDDNDQENDLKKITSHYRPAIDEVAVKSKQKQNELKTMNVANDSDLKVHVVSSDDKQSNYRIGSLVISHSTINTLVISKDSRFGIDETQLGKSKENINSVDSRDRIMRPKSDRSTKETLETEMLTPKETKTTTKGNSELNEHVNVKTALSGAAEKTVFEEKSAFSEKRLKEEVPDSDIERLGANFEINHKEMKHDKEQTESAVTGKILVQDIHQTGELNTELAEHSVVELSEKLQDEHTLNGEPDDAAKHLQQNIKILHQLKSSENEIQLSQETGIFNVQETNEMEILVEAKKIVEISKEGKSVIGQEHKIKEKYDDLSEAHNRGILVAGIQDENDATQPEYPVDNILEIKEETDLPEQIDGIYSKKPDFSDQTMSKGKQETTISESMANVLDTSCSHSVIGRTQTELHYI
ncbi:hypothetical protein DPMN_194564 [Dreissena polymorpha]|uniref:Uncharacterized protein n=1 Tax=Dreissena polymorpha TaxID=45954 RepID=A0A9D4B861_DREPO|nr:hypothetical protein DPMN_194564 [Dreissena polymorpha]